MITKRTIKVIVALIGALALLCSSLTISSALAQGSPDFSGWHAAMAIANLAEKANEQKANAERDAKIALKTAASAEETNEYQKNLDEKTTTGE